MWSQVRVLWLLIWWPLEAYMVINFRIREISRGARKLVRTPTLILIIKKYITSIRTSSNGAWQGDYPLDHAFPLLIVQTTLILVVSRLLAFLLKPLRQPKVICWNSCELWFYVIDHALIMYKFIFSGWDSAWTIRYRTKQRVLELDFPEMEHTDTRICSKCWSSFLSFPGRSRAWFILNSQER